MNLGGKIKGLREEYKLSLRGLAKKAEISVAYLARIERDEANPTTDVLSKIATIFNLSLVELLEDIDSMAKVELSEELTKFIDKYSPIAPELKEPDWQRTLMSIKFRGKQPKDPDNWYKLFLDIKSAVQDDK